MKRHLLLASFALLGTACVGSAALVFAVLAATSFGLGPIAMALLLLVTFPGLGALVATRRPDNPIGWLFLAAGFALSIAIFGSAYANYGLTHPEAPGWRFGVWLEGSIGMILFGIVVTFLLLLFPDGRLLSPKLKVVAWLAGVGIVVGTIGVAFTPGRSEDTSLPEVPNPLGVEGSAGKAFEAMGGVGWTLVNVTGLVAAVSLIARFRRARGVQRQQLKWFAYAVVILVVALVGVTASDAWATDWGGVVAGASMGFVPIAAAIAILRYRLYDIDVIINRTLVYGALTAFLAFCYYGLVLLLQSVFSDRVAGSELAVAGSTLAVASLFRPARARIQGFIDRRFYRAKYDAARTLEAFSARLRDELDLETLTAELLRVVKGTLQPAHLSLWLRAPDAS